MTKVEFYILRKPYDFWGDYSHYLMHGMAAPDDLKNGPLLLYRTGPYVPSISFPGIGDVVVTDEFKQKLEKSDLSGFSFRPIIKKKIVDLHWHKWDTTTDDPPEFPESREPEDFINERPHSPELAEKLGDLWEVVITPSASVKKIQPENWLSNMKIYLIADTWKGDDIFRAHDVLYTYLSKKAKEWLEVNAKEYVTFEETKIM